MSHFQKSTELQFIRRATDLGFIVMHCMMDRRAEIADPEHLMEGTGKFMRHVKVRPEIQPDATALMQLIETAYTDMKRRLAAEYDG